MSDYSSLPDLFTVSTPVRITVTARQTGVNAPFGVGGDSSLFGLRPPVIPPRDTLPDHVRPEDAPEALDYAVDEIIGRDTDGYAFPPEDGYSSDADDGGVSIWDALETVLRSIGEPEEGDSVVIHTLGRMEKRSLPGGYLELTIRYDSDYPEEGAETTLVLSSREPGLLTITHGRAVTSMIVLEKDVRHVTAYRTPIGTMELATLARSLLSTVSFSKGGSISADYLVEFHGMDLQYSQIRVEIVPLS